MLKTLAIAAALAASVHLVNVPHAEAADGVLQGTMDVATTEGAAVKIASHRGCVAVARTRAGRGRRVPGTRNVRTRGKRCARALRACRRDLLARQRRGKNPAAACVIARRGAV
ncbi:MAG: hypothetical protein AAGG72_09105 [Pseudomonadota bacterium]